MISLFRKDLIRTLIFFIKFFDYKYRLTCQIYSVALKMP